ncbi:N-acetyltransferase family protein [Rhizobium binxianense]
MAIVITPITTDLIEQYHHVLGVVARERRYLALGDAPPIERTRAFVQDNLDARNPHLVAMDGETVVGWCDVRRDGGFNAAHAGTLGMGLLPDYREQGIGRLLIEAALDAARAIGLTRVALRVNASNLRAIRLYEAVGFEREGVLRDAIFLDGQYQDIFMMAIVRRPGTAAEAAAIHR